MPISIKRAAAGLRKKLSWREPPTNSDEYDDTWRDEDGLLHRDNDLPAIVHSEGTKEWYQHGKVHRENDKPAKIFADGDQYWFINNELHRDNGPAIIKYNGDSKHWYQRGKYHRDDGPALELSDGTKIWYQHGDKHREDGPAVVRSDGVSDYYLNGQLVSEQRFLDRLGNGGTSVLSWREQAYDRFILKDNGDKIYYDSDRKLHNSSGPAIEYGNGDKAWYIHDKQHREDGPAVEYANGSKAWYQNDGLHRTDGPAIERADGSKEWWLGSFTYTEEEYNEVMGGINTQAWREEPIFESETYRAWKDDDKQFHRENDLPAIEYRNGDKYWYFHGVKHREDDLPAIEFADGGKIWYNNGEKHRENGPAQIEPNGAEEWYWNGDKHREGGPAVTTRDGNTSWHQHGKLHRLDGPAIEEANGSGKLYWINDLYYTEEDFYAHPLTASLDKLSWRDAPSIENDDHALWQNEYNQIHRDDDLPAAVYEDGTEYWYQYGELHRDNDMPAITRPNGEKQWYFHGELHREDDKPAIMYADGSKHWYTHDKRNRLNGPAVIYGDILDNIVEYWIDGKGYTANTYEVRLDQIRESSLKLSWKDPKAPVDTLDVVYLSLDRLNKGNLYITDISLADLDPERYITKPLDKGISYDSNTPIMWWDTMISIVNNSLPEDVILSSLEKAPYSAIVNIAKESIYRIRNGNVEFIDASYIKRSMEASLDKLSWSERSWEDFNIDKDVDDIIVHQDENGEIHSDDGPAVITKDGTKYWYQHGKIHRDNGPAIEFDTGVKSWVQDGWLHRTDGPAIEKPAGDNEYYLNGKFMYLRAWEREVARLNDEPPVRLSWRNTNFNKWNTNYEMARDENVYVVFSKPWDSNNPEDYTEMFRGSEQYIQQLWFDYLLEKGSIEGFGYDPATHNIIDVENNDVFEEADSIEEAKGIWYYILGNGLDEYDKIDAETFDIIHTANLKLSWREKTWDTMDITKPSSAGGEAKRYFNEKGEYHREDGPAIEYPGGTKMWYQHGKKHRTDGPADIFPAGFVRYWIEGKELTEEEFNQRTSSLKFSWREQGWDERQVHEDGTIRYYNEEHSLHNMDGPAIEYTNGNKRWFLYGMEYSENTHDVYVRHLRGDDSGFTEEGLKHLSWREEAYDEYDVETNGDRYYYNKEGLLHRDDGPAIERASGSKSWYKDGQLHREDGPAQELHNGTKRWWIEGKKHRLDGPAVEEASGTKRWYVSNQLHRLDGPAVERSDGSVSYAINGNWHDETTFKRVMNIASLKFSWREPPTNDDDEYLEWMDRAGQFHREDDLPARVWVDKGVEAWYWHGELHRDGDKPAVVHETGEQRWFIHGKKHRIGRPADITDSSEVWYKDGELHRTDGPAVNELNGTYQEWWIDGKKYTEEEFNAIPQSTSSLKLSWKEQTYDHYTIENNGNKSYRNEAGKLHREDGPAIIFPDGSKKWLIEGELHRMDGPAVEWASGKVEYYLNGWRHSKGTYEAYRDHMLGDDSGFTEQGLKHLSWRESPIIEIDAVGIYSLQEIEDQLGFTSPHIGSSELTDALRHYLMELRDSHGLQLDVLDVYVDHNDGEEISVNYELKGLAEEIRKLGLAVKEMYETGSKFYPAYPILDEPEQLDDAELGITSGLKLSWREEPRVFLPVDQDFSVEALMNMYGITLGIMSDGETFNSNQGVQELRDVSDSLENEFNNYMKNEGIDVRAEVTSLSGRAIIERLHEEGTVIETTVEFLYEFWGTQSELLKMVDYLPDGDLGSDIYKAQSILPYVHEEDIISSSVTLASIPKLSWRDNNVIFVLYDKEDGEIYYKGTLAEIRKSWWYMISEVGDVDGYVLRGNIIVDYDDQDDVLAKGTPKQLEEAWWEECGVTGGYSLASLNDYEEEFDSTDTYNDAFGSLKFSWKEKAWDSVDVNEDGRKKYVDEHGRPHREDGPAVIWEDGTKAWFVNGVQHREDGPALEFANGSKEWYADGKLHRIDGPAIVYADGYTQWWLQGVQVEEEEFNERVRILKLSWKTKTYEEYVNTDSGREYHDEKGQKHRLDGPAVERSDGTKEWWMFGQQHRSDGPAVEFADGTKWWMQYGEMHRDDGPAVENIDGNDQWFYKGERHRADGPALKGLNGLDYYYLHDEQMSEENFNSIPFAQRLAWKGTPAVGITENVIDLAVTSVYYMTVEGTRGEDEYSRENIQRMYGSLSEEELIMLDDYHDMLVEDGLTSSLKLSWKESPYEGTEVGIEDHNTFYRLPKTTSIYSMLGVTLRQLNDAYPEVVLKSDFPIYWERVMGNALTYLVEAGVVDRVGHGKYRITDMGRKMVSMEKGGRIPLSDILKYANDSKYSWKEHPAGSWTTEIIKFVNDNPYLIPEHLGNGAKLLSTEEIGDETFGASGFGVKIKIGFADFDEAQDSIFHASVFSIEDYLAEIQRNVGYGEFVIRETGAILELIVYPGMKHLDNIHASLSKNSWQTQPSMDKYWISSGGSEGTMVNIFNYNPYTVDTDNIAFEIDDVTSARYVILRSQSDGVAIVHESSTYDFDEYIEEIDRIQRTTDNSYANITNISYSILDLEEQKVLYQNSHGVSIIFNYDDPVQRELDATSGLTFSWREHPHNTWVAEVKEAIANITFAKDYIPVSGDIEIHDFNSGPIILKIPYTPNDWFNNDIDDSATHDNVHDFADVLRKVVDFESFGYSRSDTYLYMSLFPRREVDKTAHLSDLPTA